MAKKKIRTTISFGEDEKDKGVTVKNAVIGEPEHHTCDDDLSTVDRNLAAAGALLTDESVLCAPSRAVRPGQGVSAADVDQALLQAQQQAAAAGNTGQTNKKQVLRRKVG